MYQGFQYRLFGLMFCYTKASGWCCYNRLGQMSDHYETEEDLWKDVRNNNLKFSIEVHYKNPKPVLTPTSFTG